VPHLLSAAIFSRRLGEIADSGRKPPTIPG
jgi:hypothetical protein